MNKGYFFNCDAKAGVPFWRRQESRAGVVSDSILRLEKVLEKSIPIGDYKKLRTELSDEERAEVMKRGAVWHHGPKGEETPAVWKAKKDGKEYFITNTHRYGAVKKSLQAAINAYHNGVKQSA